MTDDGQTYRTFALMIATSMLCMFGLMYLNTYSIDHVWWSETRFYMTVIMGAAMALIMFGFMRAMYTNRRINGAIVASSVIAFVLALWLVRSQATIDDESWMKAMIPHHSIAILTSTRANIDDIRVRELADNIATAQRREIKEMEWMISDIEKNGKVTAPGQLSGREVPEFDGDT